MAFSSTVERWWTNNWVIFEWHLTKRNQLNQALLNYRGEKIAWCQIPLRCPFEECVPTANQESPISEEPEMGCKRACVCNIAIICHEADIQQRKASMSPWVWLQQLYLFCVPTWRFPAQQVSWHQWAFIVNCQVVLLMDSKLWTSALCLWNRRWLLVAK